MFGVIVATIKRWAGMNRAGAFPVPVHVIVACNVSFVYWGREGCDKNLLGGSAYLIAWLRVLTLGVSSPRYNSLT